MTILACTTNSMYLNVYNYTQSLSTHSHQQQQWAPIHFTCSANIYHMLSANTSTFCMIIQQLWKLASLMMEKGFFAPITYWRWNIQVQYWHHTSLSNKQTIQNCECDFVCVCAFVWNLCLCACVSVGFNFVFMFA